MSKRSTDWRAPAALLHRWMADMPDPRPGRTRAMWEVLWARMERLEDELRRCRRDAR